MKRFHVFPGIIFVLLGMNVAIVGYTVYAANSDGGAAIEPDYYRKALAHDSIREQERDAAALGWVYDVSLQNDAQSESATLSVMIRERDGKSIAGATVHAIAFPNIRANERSQLLLRERTPGIYSAPLNVTHFGEWRIELTIESRGQKVGHKADVDTLEKP